MVQSDSEAVFDFLHKNLGFRQSRIIVIGRSIGGGVAFTSNTNAVGVQIKSQFSIGQRWRIEGSVTGYSTNNNRDFYGDANLNANFIFTDVGAIELHALLGYNVFFGRFVFIKNFKFNYEAYIFHE